MHVGFHTHKPFHEVFALHLFYWYEHIEKPAPVCLARKFVHRVCV